MSTKINEFEFIKRDERGVLRYHKNQLFLNNNGEYEIHTLYKIGQNGRDILNISTINSKNLNKALQIQNNKINKIKNRGFTTFESVGLRGFTDLTPHLYKTLLRKKFVKDNAYLVHIKNYDNLCSNTANRKLYYTYTKNGLRCLIHNIKNKIQVLDSNNNNITDFVGYIVKNKTLLNNLKRHAIYFDCILYYNNYPAETIEKIIASKQQIDDWELYIYDVYDATNANLPFTERLKLLNSINYDLCIHKAVYKKIWGINDIMSVFDKRPETIVSMLLKIANQPYNKSDKLSKLAFYYFPFKRRSVIIISSKIIDNKYYLLCENSGFENILVELRCPEKAEIVKNIKNLVGARIFIYTSEFQDLYSRRPKNGFINYNILINK